MFESWLMYVSEAWIYFWKVFFLGQNSANSNHNRPETGEHVACSCAEVTVWNMDVLMCFPRGRKAESPAYVELQS